MTKPNALSFLHLNSQIHRFFGKSFVRNLSAEALPGDYPRKIESFKLFSVLLRSQLRLLPGIRSILEDYGPELGTANTSTLSYAMRSHTHLAFAAGMLERLSPKRYRPGELVAVDSMAVSLPATRTHGCAPMNDTTVGGGFLWAYRIAVGPGELPLRLLASYAGTRCDSTLLATVSLAPRGPVYLFDRGAYRIDLLARWLDEGVRFIQRVRKNRLCYEVVSQTGPPRRHRRLSIVLDAVVRLGSPNRRGRRPAVRLVVAALPDGEDLIVASSEMKWSAARLLDSYRKRWDIEGFHKLLKRQVGLAHVYSFQQLGIELQTLLTAILAVMLYLRETPAGEAPQITIERLQQALKNARKPLGLRHPWLPNTCGRKRSQTTGRRCSNH